jgi:segregation and condensation protein B
MDDSVDFPEKREFAADPVVVPALETIGEPVDEPEIGGEGWSGADIEEAYLKALTAMEDLPAEDEAPTEEPESALSEPVAADGVPQSDGQTNGPLLVELSPAEPTPVQPLVENPSNAQVIDTKPASTSPTGVRLAKGTERPSQATLDENSNVTPVQVIEAALFVGGVPLTARKICGLVRGTYDASFVEQTIDELNEAYLAQCRPYEIRLGEGGYRMELRPEYDRLRHRVYGSGPREVRLAQDVLEVLALVAYRQPISQKEIESHGKDNAGNLLRQLLRRDLVSFERGPGGRKDLQYQTTPRFLSVFGLASLDDMPQAEDLAKK